MKTLGIAAFSAALLALSLPADAHMRCGWQWPNDDVSMNTVHPSFSATDCMANRLNAEQLAPPAPEPMIR